ncbi:unnamed protein product, partial [Polarella glacialis]
ADAVGLIAVGLAGLGAAGGGLYAWQAIRGPPGPPEPFPSDRKVPLTNWSGTHSVVARRVFEPETQEQLEEAIAWAAQSGQKCRPMGTGLSPNGLALEKRGMLSMAQMDDIIEVDKKNMRIRVQGGTRVSKILDELQKHDLTLENFSSITEQQIGGWTQVSAHGTGARIPPVDEMVTEMTLVTPGKGVLHLSEDGSDAELFRLARVGLGSLGVVSEVTLKVRPKYSLHERTYCSSVADLRRNHAELLQKHRHVRYMWIPYTDTVVVVVSDTPQPNTTCTPALPDSYRLRPFAELLRELKPDCGDLTGVNFAQIREKCLVLDPLNAEHVARVNRAEAQFWERSSGERVADSMEILGFECGGTQWVLENCIPCGTIDEPSLADIDYMIELKSVIEREGIAAASPIEQRWTARSSSPMSPAYSPQDTDIFSWVGVIMYIVDEGKAPAIKTKFREYGQRHADLTFKYGGAFHWGKIDLDFHLGARLEEMQAAMRSRFDIAAFCKARRELDPQNVLGNKLIDTVFAE